MEERTVLMQAIQELSVAAHVPPHVFCAIPETTVSADIPEAFTKDFLLCQLAECAKLKSLGDEFDVFSQQMEELLERNVSGSAPPSTAGPTPSPMLEDDLLLEGSSNSAPLSNLLKKKLFQSPAAKGVVQAQRYSKSGAPSYQQQYSQNKRHKLTPEAARILNDWFMAHIQSPYPDDKARDALAKECGLDKKQISVWFGNKRSRYKKKAMATESDQTREPSFTRPRGNRAD
eukprot:TRINITY_DN38926_c0_g1_i1.p1 TRINITY_DN38926_c0_g1~~TRINITY_DN38926_c0_g1_i1.p1  ORF type:complete len:231 (-),score=14.82 TRINITY_DN38926_c0_g1_i1:109-801(-)